MHDIHWLVVLCFSVPECFLIISLGLQMINYKPKLYPIFITSLIYSPFVYVVRRLDLLYGLHTIIFAIIIITLTHYILKIPLLKSIIAINIGFIIALSIEAIFVPSLSFITGVSLKEITLNTTYNIIFALPELLVMSCLLFFSKKKNICLFNLNKGV